MNLTHTQITQLLSSAVLRPILRMLQCCVIVAMLLPKSATWADDLPHDDGNQYDSAVVDSFLEHLRQLDSPGSDDAIRAVQQYNDSAADAVTEGLIALYPKYAKAVEASDDDRLEDAAARLTPLTKSDDVYLAADATFFLARSYMNHERYEDAIKHLETLTRSTANVSAHQGPAQYFLGLAQAGLLKKDEAFQSFIKFLSENPQAPERMRVSAWRQAQNLRKIEEGKLADIHRRMNFSRRRLEQQKTDPATQRQQDKIVKMLNKLIKEAEKQEASSSASNTQKPQDKNKSSKKQPAGKKPSAPQPAPGKSSKGAASSQANGKAEIKNYEDTPASPWSRLRDRSRDPANNAVKEKLPARYRDIVERYMEAANGNSDE